MKVIELQTYLRSLGTGWVHPENSVDTIKSGDPQADIHGIAVAWMPFTHTIKQALDLECNVLVTHEPLYYRHQESDLTIFELPAAKQKRVLLEKQNLAVIRCHDLWDQFPKFGIPDSWGSLLAFGEPIESDGFFRVYNVSGRTALDVARQVAARTQEYGQEAVHLVGPPDYSVSRLAIGTGAITPYMTMLQQCKADIALCVDDGIFYCFDGAIAIDMNLPLIVVNHAVSEEVGVENLARYLVATFPSIPVHHIPQRCMYRMVSEQG